MLDNIESDEDAWIKGTLREDIELYLLSYVGCTYTPRNANKSDLAATLKSRLPIQIKKLESMIKMEKQICEN